MMRVILASSVRGFVLAWLPALAWAGNAMAGDWPTYRHDNARSGWTDDRLNVPLSPRWTFTSPAAPQTAWAGQEGLNREGHIMVQRVKFDDALQVVVAGDRVYFGSSVDHSLHCLRASDGASQWKFFVGGPIRLAPVVHEDRVLFGADDGYAYCLRADSGKLLWKVKPSPLDEWLLSRGEMISRWPVRTGVLVDRDVAYFGAGIFPHENVYLCAVNLRSGKVLWKQDGISETNAGRSDLSPQGHLLLQGDMLYVPSGGTLPAFVDRATGKVLQKPNHAWRTTAGGAVGGSEALLADGQLYSFGAHHVLAMDQTTSKVGFGWFAGKQMVVDDKSAYVVSGDSVLQLDRMKYAVASRKRHDQEMQIQEIMKLTGEGSSKKKLPPEAQAKVNALKKSNAELGQVGVTWKAACPACNALIGAGELLFVGQADKVTALEAASGKEVWSHAVEGNARSMAVAADSLWVSTSAGKVYCFAAGSGASQPATVAAQDPYPADAQTAAYQTAAEEILRRSGVTRGFCLVLGSDRGRLAFELAKRSQLKIYGVEPDAEKVDQSRQALSAANLYGTRVVIHRASLDAIPYSNYFANLIVVDGGLTGAALPNAQKIARHLKPHGGVVCLRTSGGATSTNSPTAWLTAMRLDKESEIRQDGNWATLTRKELPGAGSWTHQYAEPGNSACSSDQRVRGDLGVLWYGDPGPAEMVNRHSAAVAPLAMDGRFFIQGERNILAYDAYNGLFLWESPDPGANRTNTRQGNNPGNLAAGDGRIFVVAENVCRQLDAATGQCLATHQLPAPIDAATQSWQYLAYANGLLVGTTTQRSDLRDRDKRRGKSPDPARDTVFAIDVKSQRTLWTLPGHSITPTTVALSDDRVYYIDSSLTAEERETFLRQDKRPYQNLSGDEAKLAEERLKKIDLRQAVAVDARTGNVLWKHPVDVTDCSGVGTGGGKLTLMHRDGVLVLCGANGNGHYWKQFMAGEFKRRRLVALDASDGYQLWAKDANYRHRPIIVGSRVIAEPWAFDLRSGKQQMRANPLTGESVPWSIMRTGHHCGALAACPHMLTFRSGTTGYYDLDADMGTQHFAGQRPGCWINAIPANGLVIVPEASAGCVCLFSIESTIVMEPRAPRRAWSVASTAGAQTPIQHLAVNLGAPGDRRDAKGNLWLAFPRPGPYKMTGLEIALPLEAKFLDEGSYASVDSEDTRVSGTDTPWLYTSCARGLSTLRIPLLGKSDAPSRYDVKLHFAETGSLPRGTRVFDVKLQGKTIAARLDVTARSGAALVREVKNVPVTDDLLVELVPSGRTPSLDQMPLLSALEVTRCKSQ